MTSTNCLEGIACPDCGNDSRLYIEVKTLAVVYDHGAETYGDLGWDDGSYAECPECRRSGRLVEFRVEAAPENPNQATKENRP
jgi:hypothetical protein